jgi:hypothetical protein
MQNLSPFRLTRESEVAAVVVEKSARAQGVDSLRCILRGEIAGEGGEVIRLWFRAEVRATGEVFAEDAAASLRNAVSH